LRPIEGQLPDEPAEEFGEATYLVTVPGKGAGLSESQARFYAQRAIWTGNSLLLMNHVDALLPDVFGAAIRSLVHKLTVAPTGSDIALGATGCLLKALTGRTTAGLQAFITGVTKRGEDFSGGVIDPEAGLVWIPVFWKVRPHDGPAAGGASGYVPPAGYFRPKPAQRDLLIPVTEYIALPMPALVREALRCHCGTLEKLKMADAAVLDGAMRQAVVELRKEISGPFTVGALRRALGPLVMEDCGDLAMTQLICGESFGLTTAQLHYYSPKLKDVAKAYESALASQLGPSPSRRIPASARRAGSELLLQPAAAQCLGPSSLGRLP